MSSRWTGRDATFTPSAVTYTISVIPLPRRTYWLVFAHIPLGRSDRLRALVSLVSNATVNNLDLPPKTTILYEGMLIVFRRKYFEVSCSFHACWLLYLQMFLCDAWDPPMSAMLTTYGRSALHKI